MYLKTESGPAGVSSTLEPYRPQETKVAINWANNHKLKVGRNKEGKTGLQNDKSNNLSANFLGLCVESGMGGKAETIKVGRRHVLKLLLA